MSDQKNAPKDNHQPQSVGVEDGKILAILEYLVSHFAEKDEEGNWWGMDTNLGKQEEAFMKAKQAIKELL